MKKLSGSSKDLLSENIDNLKQLFPEAFTEDKIDFEALQELLGNYIERGNERYAFTWAGKQNARREAQKTSTGTLRPCPQESVNFDTTENIYIEGDNLEVLKLLQKSYHNKIKMIYIDPPYNTGKDFVYKDNYHDNLQNYKEITGQVDSEGNRLSTNSEASGRFHSNWLNMMYPRLKLARNLLKDDGVIFISIDDKEMNNLRKICDDVFGEDNYIECITWNKRIPKNDKGIGNIHEYILIYRKNKHKELKFTVLKDGLEEVYKLLNKLRKEKCPINIAEKKIQQLYNSKGYDRGITLYNSLDSNYKLWGKINMSWPNANTFGPRYEILHPKTKNAVKIPERGWRWKIETFNNQVDFNNCEELHDGSFKCGKIWFGKDETTQTSSITYLEDVERFLLRSVISLKSDGGIIVEQIFNNKNIMSYPKPVSLLKLLIDSITKDDDIIFDFFSGSATTAHAVLDLNKEDGGNRKFIMIQLPEPTDEKSEAYKAGYKTIAEIGKERIRRVINNIKKEEDGQIDFGGNSLDLGFKVLKLDSSNIKAWDTQTENLEEDLLSAVNNIKEDRSEHDILYEILIKYGFNLALPIQEVIIAGNRVFNVDGGKLICCLSDNISLETVEGIGKLKEELNPETCKVVFMDKGFKDDVVKTNAMHILMKSGIEEVRSI